MVTGAPQELVRIAASVGRRAIAICQERGVALGPVLYTPARSAVEVVVPPGTGKNWPQALPTRCVSAEELRAPAPGRLLGGGRRWLVAPEPGGASTDPDALIEAITVALVERAMGEADSCTSNRS